MNGDVETPALKEISFEIKSGEFVAIMGPSGSGKSTLLHMLGFLDEPTSGTLRFNDRLSSEYKGSEVARLRNKHMGFVFQSFNLLPRTTVLENVKLPLLYSGIAESLWHDMAMHVIKHVGLEHRIDHEPSQLSGGEKQRVAIARALVNNPSVIFADEPTGNLDSASGKAIMQVLRQMNEEEKKTVILITHETATAEYAQRIIRVRDGFIESDQKVVNRRTEGDIK